MSGAHVPETQKKLRFNGETGTVVAHKYEIIPITASWSGHHLVHDPKHTTKQERGGYQADKNKKRCLLSDNPPLPPNRPQVFFHIATTVSTRMECRINKTHITRHPAFSFAVRSATAPGGAPGAAPFPADFSRILIRVSSSTPRSTTASESHCPSDTWWLLM